MVGVDVPVALVEGLQVIVDTIGRANPHMLPNLPNGRRIALLEYPFRNEVEDFALPVGQSLHGGTRDTQQFFNLSRRRLEDVGVRVLTIHCRTAKMGHSGEADWSWAAKS